MSLLLKVSTLKCKISSEEDEKFFHYIKSGILRASFEYFYLKYDFVLIFKHYNFLNVFKNSVNLVLLESHGRNEILKMENILEKRRIKVEKIEYENWKQLHFAKVDQKTFVLSDHGNIFFLFFLSEYWIRQLYIHLPSNFIYMSHGKKIQGCFFSTDELQIFCK